MAASIIVGSISGLIFTIIGIIHNTQSEFQLPNGDFDFWYAIQVFASWLVPTSAIFFILLTTWNAIRRER